MSNKLIKSNNIEFIIVDVIEFRKQTRFPDGVWDIIKDFIGFFTRPQIVRLTTKKLCLEIHWNCKECKRNIDTTHNPNKMKIKLLLNEITYHQICIKCDGTFDEYQKKRTGEDCVCFNLYRNEIRIQDRRGRIVMTNH
jgi:hypothetical protein